jgi:FimV-like protein
MKNAWNRVFGGLQQHAICVCLILASQSVLAASTDREALYAKARDFLANGEAKKAYELLIEKESLWSGRDDYDYLLGVAALDSGEASESVFTLQRLVMRKPGFSGARLELARAYFELGENESARREFEKVLTEDPPPNVVEASNEYLKAIDARARQYRSDVQYTFDFGLGYDSNAPAATADDVFLNFTLSPNNLEQSSAFANTGLGAVYTRPVGPKSQVILNANIDHRTNPSTHFVDSSNLNLGAGWSWQKGVHSVAISANRIYSWLDRRENKHDTGLNLTYGRKLSDSWNMMAFSRVSQVRFEESALQVQDVDRLTYGFSVTQSFETAVMNVSLTGGGDDAKQSTSAFSTDTYGINFSNTWYRAGGKQYFLDAGVSNTEYDDPFFGIDREDDLLTLGVGTTWANFPLADWTSTFRVSFSEKDSTVSLYEFDRVEAGLSLQKLF